MNPLKVYPKYKRRIYYITKAFQRDFIIKFCVLTGFASVLTMGLIYWLAKNSTTVAIQQGHIAVHTTAEYLLPLMLQTVSIQCIISIVATILLTLIISHRIAGPLYRFKVMFKLLSQGDLSTQMCLRRHDQLKDLALSYNEALNIFNNKIKHLKSITSMDDIKKELDKFKTS